MPVPEPIIIEPDTQNPKPTAGKFLLYDYQFEEDKYGKFELLETDRKLYLPHFGIGGIADWAFGTTTEWLRRQMHAQKGPLEYHDGTTHQTLTLRHVKGRGIRPERRLTLPDIERLAWVFYERGGIDGYTLEASINVIHAVAQHYLRDRRA